MLKYLKLILLFVTLPLILNAQNKTYWWNDQVFYEIFVRSFYDSNGDGIGDFKGLTKKLDYLNDGNPASTTDLGVTALWLMPIMESPSYHGYDVTDYKKIQNIQGKISQIEEIKTQDTQIRNNNKALKYRIDKSNKEKLQKYNKLLQTVWKNKSFCILNVSSRNGIMIYCVVGHCEQMTY